jgi:uncharacterized protein YjbI with pentapeptide repeats/tetratricopeptide (TPR) repeat protein
VPQTARTLEPDGADPAAVPGDLRGRDLTGASIDQKDLSGRDLTDAVLAGASLRGARLRGARLVSADLSGADLDGAVLDGADLSGASLRGARLHRASLAGATLVHTEWREARAEDADLGGADLGGAHFERTMLSRCGMRAASLRGAKLEQSDFAECALDGASFAGASVADCSFVDCDAERLDLTGAAFRFVDVTRTPLPAAVLDGTRFESVAFRRSPVLPASASGAEFAHSEGLDRPSQQAILATGGAIVLSLPRRLLAAIVRRRAGLVAAVLLLLSASAGLAFYTLRSLQQGEDDWVPVSADDLPAEASDAWRALEARYAADPENRVEILLGMTRLLESVGRLDAARSRYRELLDVLQSRPQEPGEGPLLAMANFLIRHDEIDTAVTLARELDQPGCSVQESAVAHYLLARSFLSRELPAEAQREARAMAALLRDAETPLPALRVEAARLLGELGTPQDALPVVPDPDEATDLDVRADIELLRASLLAAAGDVRSAVIAYDAAAAEFADIPLLAARVRDERAAALQRAGDPGSQATSLEAISGGAAAEAAQAALALLRLRARSDAASAPASYLAFLDRPELADALRAEASAELADLLLQAGRGADAETMLAEQRGKVAVRGEQFRLDETLVRVHRGRGDLARAESVALQARKRFADDRELSVRATLQLAGIVDAKGRIGEASKLYDQVAAAALDAETTAAAKFGKASMLRRDGRADDALALMDDALAAQPAGSPVRALVRAERAELLHELGRASPAAIEATLADARADGDETAHPVQFASLLLVMALELAEENRHADALSTFQRVAASPAAAETPALKQAALEGEVRSLVALGRGEEARRLLGGQSPGGLADGGGSDACRAQATIAKARAASGDADGAVTAWAGVVAGCKAPPFLLEALPELSDSLAERGRYEDAGRLLRAVRDDGAVPAVGRQAAALELGRLGSDPDLELAAGGPDPALAALARVEQGSRLLDRGDAKGAEVVLRAIADDDGVEAFPRALARLGLGRAREVQDDATGARAWYMLARDGTQDAWLRGAADDALRGLGP